jgi:hypothetical protein
VGMTSGEVDREPVDEIGTYLGKSAIHLGRFVRAPHELFGEGPSCEALSPAAREFCSWSFRNDFERHCLSFHRELPCGCPGGCRLVRVVRRKAGSADGQPSCSPGVAVSKRQMFR